MNQLNVSADLLVQLLTKLALLEQQEALIRERVDVIEAVTGEKLPECHCPSCLMPDLAKALNAEIATQLKEGENIDDLASQEVVERIEDGLRKYIMEREQMRADELFAAMPNDGVVN